MDDKGALKELVRAWLEKASHDRGIAETLLSQNSPYTDGICFHCQQAVEKMLKASLVFLGITFKKSHNLVYLLDLLSTAEGIPDIMYEHVECLETYAVEVRYPDTMTIPSIDETKDALLSVEFVEIEVNRILKSHGF